MVSLNTDDPSVFHTSLANEYGEIYYSLRYNGMSAEEALHEMELIREISMNTSFLTSPIELGQLLAEYEETVRGLRI